MSIVGFSCFLQHQDKWKFQHGKTLKNFLLLRYLKSFIFNTVAELRLKSMFVSLEIIPFDSISDAIDGFEVAFEYDSLKFKCQSFSSYERERLVKLLTACKAMLTIENRFNEFARFHKINCSTKILWNNTTWKVQVKDFRNRIEVLSGSYFGFQNSMSLHNEKPYCAQTMIVQLQQMLSEAQTIWGIDSFNWMYSREVKIISKERRFNKYAPCGDYYDIYSGNRSFD